MKKVLTGRRISLGPRNYAWIRARLVDFQLLKELRRNLNTIRSARLPLAHQLSPARVCAKRAWNNPGRKLARSEYGRHASFEPKTVLWLKSQIDAQRTLQGNITWTVSAEAAICAGKRHPTILHGTKDNHSFTNNPKHRKKMRAATKPSKAARFGPSAMTVQAKTGP